MRESQEQICDLERESEHCGVRLSVDQKRLVTMQVLLFKDVLIYIISYFVNVTVTFLISDSRVQDDMDRVLLKLVQRDSDLQQIQDRLGQSARQVIEFATRCDGIKYWCFDETLYCIYSCFIYIPYTRLKCRCARSNR